MSEAGSTQAGGGPAAPKWPYAVIGLLTLAVIVLAVLLVLCHRSEPAEDQDRRPAPAPASFITSSGIRMDILEQGRGAPVTAADAVRYELSADRSGEMFEAGSLTSGSVAQLTDFPQALLRMQEGGLYRIHLPAEVARNAPSQSREFLNPDGSIDLRMRVVRILRGGAANVDSRPMMDAGAGNVTMPVEDMGMSTEMPVDNAMILNETTNGL